VKHNLQLAVSFVSCATCSLTNNRPQKIHAMRRTQKEGIMNCRYRTEESDVARLVNSSHRVSSFILVCFNVIMYVLIVPSRSPSHSLSHSYSRFPFFLDECKKKETRRDESSEVQSIREKCVDKDKRDSGIWRPCVVKSVQYGRNRGAPLLR
jgi:hypothetical protein